MILAKMGAATVGARECGGANCTADLDHILKVESIHPCQIITAVVARCAQNAKFTEHFVQLHARSREPGGVT